MFSTKFKYQIASITIFLLLAIYVRVAAIDPSWQNRIFAIGCGVWGITLAYAIGLNRGDSDV